jgi:hypothetical protein
VNVVISTSTVGKTFPEKELDFLIRNYLELMGILGGKWLVNE